MDFNKLKNYRFEMESDEDSTSDNSENGIAIIGINARIGYAENADSFWEYLSEGCDLIGDFPEGRRDDADKLNRSWFNFPLSEDLRQAAYLRQVDSFDADFFNMPPVECELMDPAHKILLESAWLAFEDAGCSPRSLKGTNTSVCIGYGSDDNPYHSVIWNSDKNVFGVAVTGNINSLMAGRISYLLDLKGPAIMVDTTCSSSLAAVHVACQQLKSGEASMALAGGIKLMLIPPGSDMHKIGVESSSDRTRTLDSEADGTGRGEGVVTMVLKPYAQAKADKDHIYAIISGSVMNQDGASLGITAPNAKSQESAIVAAWNDAGIDPETVSYIEMHGTATNLGDPAEITGITNAFRKFTGKQQFCAVGSVKSNVGHLDGTAGITGLLKVVLMLKNKKIPPLVHFKSPNYQLDLIKSPVYVNDKLQNWDPPNGIRRCGVSSFGIGGTNCHAVVEEAAQSDEREFKNRFGISVLTASAKSKEALISLLHRYKAFLLNNPDCDLDNFCYTANTGRGQYRWRFGAVINTAADFTGLPIEECLNGVCFWFGEHKIGPRDSINTGIGVTDEELKNISMLAQKYIKRALEESSQDEYRELLCKVMDQYIRGADINWSLLYGFNHPAKMSIPGYPFNRNRYWAEFKVPEITHAATNGIHPLIDECIVASEKVYVFVKRLCPETSWELREHLINGVHILPGTAFIEMARESLRYLWKSTKLEFQQLLYLTPLAYKSGDKPVLLNIILRIENQITYVEFQSRNGTSGEWINHASMKAIQAEEMNVRNRININEIINRCKRADDDMEAINKSIVKISGDHWNNADGFYFNENEALVHFGMNEDFRDELKFYGLHPAMLDSAINAGSYLTDSIFLPFSFQQAKFYQNMPARFYSWVKKSGKYSESDKPVATFDIKLCTEDGEIFGEIDEYMLKRVDNPKEYLYEKFSRMKNESLYYSIKWDKEPKKIHLLSSVDNNVLIILSAGQEEYLRALKSKINGSVIAVFPGDSYEKISENTYAAGNSLEGYEKLLKSIKPYGINRIINLAGCLSTDNSPLKSAEEEISVLQNIFYLVKALFTTGYEQPIELNLITKDAFMVTGKEAAIHPARAMLASFGDCIECEYGNIKVHSVDFDSVTEFSSIVSYILNFSDKTLEVFREGERYVKKLADMQPRYDSKDDVIRAEGTYVIAGGIGGIGLAVADRIFTLAPNASVVLLSRKYCDSDLSEKNVNDDEKIKKARILSEKYHNLHIVKADICSIPDVKSAIDFITRKYGRINGIVNAAGIAGKGFIFNKEWSSFYNVLAPKILGSAALHEYTKYENIDFFVMCSSCSSVFAAGGQSDYVAANAYLDSFAFYRKSIGLPALTINWTGWKESGMAKENSVDESKSYTEFITDNEGASAFIDLLSEHEESQVVVGRLNSEVLSAERNRIDRVITLPDIALEETGLSQDGYGDWNIDSISVDGIDTEVLSDVEKKVIFAWSKALRAVRVDVHEKFFDAGGNSLLAALLHKELDKLFPEVISIAEIFVYSTIAEMSKKISEKIKTDSSKDVLDEIKEKVDIESLVSRFASGELGFDAVEKIL